MTDPSPIRSKTMSRAEAIRRRLTRYFTNRPCPRGHLAERYTASRSRCAYSDASVRERAKRRREQAGHS